MNEIITATLAEWLKYKNIWFSASGGTVRILAGIISRFYSVPFEQAIELTERATYWHPDYDMVRSQEYIRNNFSNTADVRGYEKYLKRYHAKLGITFSVVE
jgi:hypothetical protein